MATSFTTHSAGQVIASADINLIQTAVNTLENAPASAGVFTPTALGYTGWSFDPAFSGLGSTALASGQVFAVALNLSAGTVTNLLCHVSTAGATTNFLMALYTQGGVLLSSSANIAANANAIGVKVFPLAVAQVVTTGVYYAAVWISGATGLALGALSSGAAAPLSINTIFRVATSGTAATTSAPSPLGTLTVAGKAVWVASS